MFSPLFFFLPPFFRFSSPVSVITCGEGDTRDGSGENKARDVAKLPQVEAIKIAAGRRRNEDESGTSESASERERQFFSCYELSVPSQ